MTSHDPYWHAGGERRWTPDEEQTLRDSLKAGERYRDIATKMRRTLASVKCHARYMKMTVQERAELQRMKTLARPQTIRMKILHEVDRAPVIPIEVLEDRARRYLAPRSLTAILMGDPPVGYSARERHA